MSHDVKVLRDVRVIVLPHPRNEEFVPRLKKPLGLMALDDIAVALAALLCLECYGVARHADVPTQPLPEVANQIQLLQSRNVTAPQPEVLTLRDIILNRPLFNPTRRPPAKPTQDVTAPVDMPRLSGIMITPTTKIAVLSPAMGAPVVVNQNSRFGAFTVLAISNDSVTMQGPQGVIRLRSDFGQGGDAETSAAKTTILVSGVYLNLIKVALPHALNGQGPPPAH
jgi:hypothetical protein